VPSPAVKEMQRRVQRVSSARRQCQSRCASPPARSVGAPKDNTVCGTMKGSRHARRWCMDLSASGRPAPEVVSAKSVTKLKSHARRGWSAWSGVVRAIRHVATGWSAMDGSAGCHAIRKDRPCAAKAFSVGNAGRAGLTFVIRNGWCTERESPSQPLGPHGGSCGKVMP